MYKVHSPVLTPCSLWLRKDLVSVAFRQEKPFYHLKINVFLRDRAVCDHAFKENQKDENREKIIFLSLLFRRHLKTRKHG